MTKVSITEFRKNMNHYLDLCSTEYIYLTRNGKVVALLSGLDDAYYQNLRSLEGCLQDGDKGEPYDKMIGDEILRRCGFVQ